ncbi:JAB domain-containing protein [Spiroplasma endosymbiont of Tiphia femorata]|uniref:JAB domain-containing protein n=1 Tax=Spiroplasma endosymbiont of Tiphia femorata TaxID=3066326 RepID=UPI003BB1BFDF
MVIVNPHYLIYISPKKLKKNFQVFNITLVDHIIIGKGNYFSINLNKKYYKFK